MALGAILAVAFIMAAAAFTASTRAAAINGVSSTPAATVDRAEKPTALFIGDSYTAGVGATSFDNTFATLVSIDRGWIEVNAGYGGTGYLATAGESECGQPSCPDFEGALDSATETDPAIVVISGGRNDVTYGLGAVRVGVEKTFARAREIFPFAQIYVTTPLWDDRRTPTFITNAADVVCQSAQADRIACLRLGQPLRGDQDLISDDGIHPNDRGHAAIAQAVIDALKAAGE